MLARLPQHKKPICKIYPFNITYHCKLALIINCYGLKKLGNFDVPAQWALAIRTQPDQIGPIAASDIEIKLMSHYN